MATPMLRSAVAGLALRRSASLRLPARSASAVSFSSNTAAGRFEKRHVDENDDESRADAARRRHKQERHGISRSHAGDSGDSSWMTMMLDDDGPTREPSTGPDSATNSSSTSRASAATESDVSSPSSGGFWGGESSCSWGSGGGDSSFGGGGSSFEGGGCSGD